MGGARGLPDILIGGEAAVNQQREFRDRRLNSASLLGGGVRAGGRTGGQVFVLDSRVLVADRQTGRSVEGGVRLSEGLRVSAVCHQLTLQRTTLHTHLLVLSDILRAAQQLVVQM